MVAVETTYQWNKRLIDVLAGQAEKTCLKLMKEFAFLNAKQQNKETIKTRKKEWNEDNKNNDQGLFEEN